MSSQQAGVEDRKFKNATEDDLEKRIMIVEKQIAIGDIKSSSVVNPSKDLSDLKTNMTPSTPTAILKALDLISQQRLAMKHLRHADG